MAEEKPFELFREWYASARSCAEIIDASAMSLATADPSGRPAVRMVLLKHFDERGFVFYTNLKSPKARDLSDNPQAALCFHWPPLRRQVRIRGAIEPVSGKEADEYFATRPRLSQLGAWASAQSTPMPHRFALETAVASVAVQFGVGAVPRPPHWSGFRLLPDEMEFWTERPFRHHERADFRKQGDVWERQWLFP